MVGGPPPQRGLPVQWFIIIEPGLVGMLTVISSMYDPSTKNSTLSEYQSNLYSWKARLGSNPKS